MDNINSSEDKRDDKDIPCIFIKYEDDTSEDLDFLFGDTSTKTTEEHSSTKGDIAMSNTNAPQDNDHKEIAAGKYMAKITDCHMESKSHDIVRMKFEITSGEYSGRVESKCYQLTTADAVEFLQREFKLLDAEINSPDELPERCEQVVGKSVGIHIRYLDNGNKNVYLVKVPQEKSNIPSRDELWKKSSRKAKEPENPAGK